MLGGTTKLLHHFSPRATGFGHVACLAWSQVCYQTHDNMAAVDHNVDWVASHVIYDPLGNERTAKGGIHV